MPTKRELRLARAIEDLSGADLVRFVDWLGYQNRESDKMLLARRALQWAQKTREEAETQQS